MFDSRWARRQITMDYGKKALTLHKKLAGKITVSSKIPIRSKDLLSTVYTPGVGAVSSKIAQDKNSVWEFTGKGNTVAIISDGTAVLGLGNVGPEAGLPVMEGKAALFAQFGNVNAYPLCIRTNSVDEIASTIRIIEPSFGGINLEDIAAPHCFELEERLAHLPDELGIPVFHDDQDGTAIVVLAALVNATRLLGRSLHKLRIVIIGAGAAASAVTWLLLGREKWQAQKKIAEMPFDIPGDVILVDSKGIINERRADLTLWKKMLAAITNKDNKSGGLDQALAGADVVIGLSAGGKLTIKQVGLMNKQPIVFALANPIPEITPHQAKKAGAALIATGRSDFPNQINNALVFPGIFRGLLDAHAREVSARVKLAAVRALVDSIQPTKTNLMPSVLDKQVHYKLAQAVKKAAA